MNIVKVNEEYQQGYTYSLDAPVGKDFDTGFEPQLSPKDMLRLGIFGGNYFVEIPKEFPADWFDGVALSSTGSADKNLNYFKVNASQPLHVWQQRGWIYPEDPKGWFLWYCRYYIGRRIPEEDARQIKRWQAITRHIKQVQNNCRFGDESCRPRQRQALLHWAYDSRKI
jgi:hypothetical protein